MKKIKFSLIFNRTNKLNKDGEGLIQIRAYQNAKNRYFTTGIYVKPSQWDNRRNEIKKHPNDHVFNKRIHEQLDMYRDFENDMINHQKYCSIDDLSVYVQSRGLPTFFEFCDEELKNSRLTASSKQSQQNSINKLKEYRKTLFFRDLTYSLIDGFDNYLRKCKLSDTTIAKHHKDLKKYINLAIKKDYLDINKNPYKKFTVKRGTTKPRTFLTMAELDRLAALEFSWQEEYLEVIRDAYLFGCYTGLRFGDLVRVSKSCIIEGERGLTLEMQAEKTKKYFSLPLYNLFKLPGTRSRPEMLMDKYLVAHKKRFDNHPAFEKELFFKGLTNQYFNRELKELATRARISKKVTAHVSRHTFGTHLATRVNPTVLKELMQHSKIATTMVYVQLSKKVIDNELDNANW